MGRHALVESPLTTVLPEQRSETAARIGMAFARSTAGRTQRHSYIALGDKAISVAELLQKYGKKTEMATEYTGMPTQHIQEESLPPEPPTMQFQGQKASPASVIAVEPTPAVPMEPMPFASALPETPPEIEILHNVPDFPTAQNHIEELPLLTHNNEEWTTSYSGATAEQTVESWRSETPQHARMIGEILVSRIAIADTGVDTIPPVTLPLVRS